MRRNVANPADVLRFMKQPTGATREVARAADYMNDAVRILKTSLERRRKRSINATGV